VARYFSLAFYGLQSYFLFKPKKDSLANMLCCLFSVFNKKLTKGDFSSIFAQNLEFSWSCGRVVTCVFV
jgi:hypothetical protein